MTSTIRERLQNDRCSPSPLGASEIHMARIARERSRRLVLRPVLVHELHHAVALLKLNPIAYHGRLPIFQLLATI